MSLQAAAMALYIGVIRPQKSRLTMVMNVVSELLLVFIHAYSIVFLDENLTEDDSLSKGFVIIATVSFYIFINWCIVIYITAQNVCGKIKAKK
jgi:hypothetical protein